MKGFKKAASLFGAVAGLLVVLIALKLSSVDEKDKEYYDKAKTSRRGALRKAKENKESVSFSQQRQGVHRTLFFDDSGVTRREFHLQADGAIVDLELNISRLHPLETFLEPHGWLQQKVGWELPDGVEIEPSGDTFCTAKTKKQIAPELLEKKNPFQVIRYYDAVKAVWDVDNHTLVLYQVNFSDYKKAGHEASSDIAQATLLLQGYADEMTMRFKAGGKEEISSTGMKLKLMKGFQQR